MATDLARFPFPSLHNPSAATVFDAVAHDAVSSGFAVLTFKANDPDGFIGLLRAFTAETRRCAPVNRLVSISAYRQLRRDEAGGAVPYDQAICETLFNRAPPVQELFLKNALANWLVYLEFETPEAALAFTESLSAGEYGSHSLIDASSAHSFGAFRNARQYTRVLNDPNLIQFFNLFPGPGSLDVTWQAWLDATPWFFEYAEVRSSFPLLALDEKQPVLLVNPAHFDSLKHFIHCALYDQYLRENVLKGIYGVRQVNAPQPFFCKIVPV